QARHRLHTLQDRAARIELHLLLREVADLHAVADAHALAAHDALEQRRLAGAVRADERDVLAPLEGEGRAAQELAVADADVEAVGLDHDAAAPRGLQELEPERSPLARQQGDLVGSAAPLLLEPTDLRQLRLRLLGLRLLVPEALDEALEPLDVRMHPVGLLLRVDQPRRLLTPPRVPRPGEERAPTRDDLEWRGREGSEEPAGVRDEDHGGVK